MIVDEEVMSESELIIENEMSDEEMNDKMWRNKRNDKDSKINIMGFDYAIKQIAYTNEVICKISKSVIEVYQ
jgi:hypothetical protein